MKPTVKCPFCGGRVIQHPAAAFASSCRCMLCGATGPVRPTVIEAIEAWDRRELPPSASPVTHNPKEDAFYAKHGD